MSEDRPTSVEQEPDPARVALFERRVEVVTEVLDKALERYELQNPAWLALTLVDLIRGGLHSLRHLLEDPEEREVSWRAPWAELHFPAGEWRMEDGRPNLWHGLAFSEEDFRDWPTADPPEDAAHWTEALRRIPEHLHGKLGAFFDAHLRLETLKQLTGGAVWEKSGGIYTTMLPADFLAELGDLSPAERDTFIEDLFEPLTIGGEFLSDEELGEIAAEGRALGGGKAPGDDGEESSEVEPEDLIARLAGAFMEALGSISIEWASDSAPDLQRVTLHPVFSFEALVADREDGQCFYPVVVALPTHDPNGEEADPSLWPEEEFLEFSRGIWDALEDALRRLETPVREWQDLAFSRVRPTYAWIDAGRPYLDSALVLPRDVLAIPAGWDELLNAGSLPCVTPQQAAEIAKRFADDSVHPKTLQRRVKQGLLPGLLKQGAERSRCWIPLEAVLLDQSRHSMERGAGCGEDAVLLLNEMIAAGRLSIDGLATKLGVTRQTLWFWRARRKIPRPEHVDAVRSLWLDGSAWKSP
jgi:hypothetical protein